MKYFTPDLIARYGSQDDAIADIASREWDETVQRYHRRLERILPLLPASVRRWRGRALCLHDARVVRLGQEDEQFLMVVEPVKPDGSLVVLAFTLNGEPEINPAALSGGPHSTGMEWMYEEWHLDRNRKNWFEVLFTNGWWIRLPFRAFEFRIVQKLHLTTESPNGIATALASPLSA